ncbi:DUF3953 domain-containing protein [Sediminibacillus massiliensis]|uniref:DUF3953 domain-containing protein n=1 Tax=Sediminibacillus massiliensis TaxID=1926277 RepID=UPI0009883B72|nr:DUF3953 domain-containing protein [Sediminibacillus massiliensis]
MLKIINLVLSIVVIALSGYSLFTQSFEIMPYMMSALGALVFTAGLREMRKNNKGFWGYACVAVSLFVFYTAVQGFLI